MDGYISISISTPHIVNCIYRRLSGELKSLGVEPYVEGNVIKIPRGKEIENAVWRVVKTTPTAVFLSIDFK